MACRRSAVRSRLAPPFYKAGIYVGFFFVCFLAWRAGWVGVNCASSCCVSLSGKLILVSFFNLSFAFSGELLFFEWPKKREPKEIHPV